MIKRLAPVLLALSAALWTGGARAEAVGSIVRGELLQGWRMDEARHMAGLHITLAPGWKTYWRAPGDAGIPPRFDWSGSRNVANVALHWPAPIVFDQLGLRSVGYAGELTLPIEVSLERPGQAARIAGTVEIGVCETICVPVSLAFSAELPVEGRSAGSGHIAAALDNRPMTAREASVAAVTCDLSPIPDGMRVAVSVVVPPLGADETAVLEHADGSIWVGTAEVVRSAGVLTATADLVPPDAAPFALSRDDLRLTLLAGGRAVDVRGCDAPR